MALHSAVSLPRLECLQGSLLWCGDAALEIRHHFCHILLLKTGYRASADSNGEVSPPLVGEWQGHSAKMHVGEVTTTAATFGNMSYHTIWTCFILAGNPL